MTNYKKSGVFMLQTSDSNWFSDDISLIVEDILESGEVDNVGTPQDIIDRLEESDDSTEFSQWISNNVVELLLPIQE